MMETPDSGTEVVGTRVFAVSRERLFGMFADPGKLAQWWGPAGFTNTFHDFDFRPGGKWRLTMHGPDGANYENEKTFVEVIEPERIVVDHFQAMHMFRMTMTYEEVVEGTRLTWRMVFEDGAANEKFRDFIVAANEENFDRLEAMFEGGDA